MYSQNKHNNILIFTSKENSGSHRSRTKTHLLNKIHVCAYINLANCIPNYCVNSSCVIPQIISINLEIKKKKMEYSLFAPTVDGLKP